MVVVNRDSYWERQEQVERFAGRDVDKRLAVLINDYSDPSSIRVLDLGCAGGRNAFFLAENGFDLFAIDASEAMVEKTRERVSAIRGKDFAETRVLRMSMDDLSFFSGEQFQLIIALGILHNARSDEEWKNTLSELRRIARSGSRLLVSNLSSESDPSGEGLVWVPGSRHLYEGFGHDRMYLMTAENLDTELHRFGFVPEVPTETVRREMDRGFRVTVNGLYVKTGK